MNAKSRLHVLGLQFKQKNTWIGQTLFITKPSRGVNQQIIPRMRRSLQIIERFGQPQYLTRKMATPFRHIHVDAGIKSGQHESTLRIKVEQIQLIFKAASTEKLVEEGGAGEERFEVE